MAAGRRRRGVRTSSWFGASSERGAQSDAATRLAREAARALISAADPAKKKPKRDGPGDGQAPLAARKVGLRPTKEQKRALRAAFDAHRHVYNDAAEAINWGVAADKKALRALLLNGDAWKAELAANPGRGWEGVPYDLLDGALDDALNAAKAARTLNRERGADKDNWTLKHRDRKSACETFTLFRKHLNKPKPKGKRSPGFWNALFGYAGSRECMALRDKKGRLPDAFAHDAKVKHNRVLDTYTLVLVDARAGDGCAREGTARKPVCGVDPGARTFATVFDPAGAELTKWGCAGPEKPASRDVRGREKPDEASANARLWRLANQLQSLKKRMGDARSRTRHRMQRAAARIEFRVRCLVDELHHKLALWLCRSFDTILLPEFDVKGVAQKRDAAGAWKRKIAKKTVRQLYSLSHYRFRVFLGHKAQQLGTRLVLVSEAYTTKTCGACGFVKHDVGAAKVFACDRCGARIDRDANGARNVYLKFIRDAGVAV